MADALAQHPVLGLLAPATRADLLRASATRQLPVATRVISEGEIADSVFALVDGAVRVTVQAPSGEEVLVKLFDAPATFGEAEAFHGVRYLENVETLAPSTLVVMPVATLRAALATSSDAALAFIDDLAARLAISIYDERSLAFNPVTIRLANFLLDYVEWSNAGTRRWQIALSQDQMAAAIGVTRRSIGKDVTAWQAEGILERRDGVYVVKDPAALARFADPERLQLLYRITRRR